MRKIKIKIIAMNSVKIKISKLFQTGAGVYKPLIVIKDDPISNGASSGIGNALKAAKYQENI